MEKIKIVFFLYICLFVHSNFFSLNFDLSNFYFLFYAFFLVE